MFSLDNREKLLLLRIARRAMAAAAEHRQYGEDLAEAPRARGCGGVFVTLRSGRRLRGCIGQIGLQESVAEITAQCARSAALEDPRFEPVRPDELADIEIELSILSPQEPVAADEIQAGKHGLIVSKGCQRGVLLPQVAKEYGWGSLRFLEETCAKAGLKRDAWRDPETQILAFTAEVFSESEILRAAEAESAGSRQ